MISLARTSTLLLALTAAACEGDQGPPGPPGGLDPDLPALDKAYLGAGGQDALVALESFEIAASGQRLMTLEGTTPEDGAWPASTFELKITADVAGDRLHIANKRAIPYFGAMTDYRTIIAGKVGAFEGVDNVFGAPAGAMLSDRWAATMRQHRLLVPQLILRDVALGALPATDAGLVLRDGELRHRIDVADPVHPISLYVDRGTGEITSVATAENDYVAGDVSIEVHFAGWRRWDGDVRFPADVVLAIDGEPWHVEHRTAIATNVRTGDALFAFPAGSSPQHVDADARRGARNSQFHEAWEGLGIGLDGLQTFVEPHAISPGVWHLRGGTHNSLVVEQAAGVVVVEAPLYEARAQALYAWIAANIPGKPVTHVISSHHHRDHAGSLRTFVARGARVVLGEVARPYFARAFRAARTIEPDELAAAPRAAVIDAVPVGGSLLIDDPVRPVRAVHCESTHAADLVVAHLPVQRVVFVSDIYSPGPGPARPDGARELLSTIQSRNLAVDIVAGGHGITGTRAELEAAAGGP